AQNDSLAIAQDSINIVVDSIQIPPAQNIEDAGYTNPQLYVLGDMEISGENRFTKTQILRFTGLRVGEELEIPGTKINNDLIQLWRNILLYDLDFYVARIEGDKIFLRLHLVGLPELVELNINGLKKSKREDFIKDHKLEPGIKVTSNLKNQVRNSIKNHFLEKGYPDAKVEFIESEVPGDKTKTNLTINVQRGERVKIKNIEFTGNNELRDGQLRRKGMKETKKKSLNVFKPSKFIPHKYKEDLKKVV